MKKEQMSLIFVCLKILKMNEEQIKILVDQAVDKKLVSLIENFSFFVPVGTILAYGRLAPPKGFLACNGASYNKNEYDKLYRIIGYTFGGDISGEFRVPDLRTKFLRGTNELPPLRNQETVRSTEYAIFPERSAREILYPRNGDEGENIGHVIGTYQKDAVREHSHKPLGNIGNFWGIPGNMDTDGIGAFVNDPDNGHRGAADVKTGGIVDAALGVNTSPDSTETRPVNVLVQFIIKY